MSDRASLFIVVMVLLIAAALRTWDLTALPYGLHADEITNIRIIETARAGNIEIFYDIGRADRIEGREGLYHAWQAFATAIVGTGSLGYRLASVWVGLFTIALTYAAGRRLIGQLGGLSAAGLLTVSLWPVLLSRQITPSVMLPALVLGVLILLMGILPVYRRRWRRGNTTGTATGLGVLLGMCIYAHPAGLLILLFSLLFIAYMLRTRGSVSRQISRRRNSYIGLMLFIVVVLSVPYVVSTLNNFEASGIRRFLSEHVSDYMLRDTLNSLGGLMFVGDQNPTRNLPGRPLFDPFSGLLILGGIGWAIYKRDEPRYALLLIVGLTLSPLFLFSANAPNFNNYAPILPVLALFFGVAASALYHHTARGGQYALALGLIGLLTFNLSWTAYDMGAWRDDPAVQTAHHHRLGQLAAYVDRSGGTRTVICGWRADQSPTATRLTDAQFISLLLNRHAQTDIRYADCRYALVLTAGGAQQQVIIPNADIFEQMHDDISAWLAMGDYVDDDTLPAGSVLVMDVEQALADKGGQLTTGQMVSYAPESGGEFDGRWHTPISFGGNLTLLGYITDAERIYQPNDVLTVTSYWRIQGTVPPDLRLFTHILSDPSASPPANTDVIHVNPRFLRDRDVVVQVTAVPLPSSLPDGDYHVSIGGYQDSSDIRLNVLANGEQRGTRLFLDGINVTAPEPEDAPDESEAEDASADDDTADDEPAYEGRR
ncbi:MAG: hypothetical protein EA396_10660 [Anaerolineaceae bacterium]|nr:MAG: hypothetical protein EA396_10660 [Anaerolineaceae bacterium]